MIADYIYGSALILFDIGGDFLVKVFMASLHPSAWSADAKGG
jgi:hypothetical protein